MLYSLHIHTNTNCYVFFAIYQVLVVSIVCFEIHFSLYIFFLLICSHCTLQASHEQAILYLRFLLFSFIFLIFSCMTCMKIIGHDCKNIYNK